MEICNYNGEAVTAEVARLKGSPSGDDACWCPLCEADTICLALSMLPPCYGRENGEQTLEQIQSNGFIPKVVRRARERVSTAPRHGKVSGEFPRYEIEVVNYSLDEGTRLLDETMQDGTIPCGCALCRVDILAFALNRIPPIYGVGLSGRTSFAPLRKEYVRQDLRKVLGAAAVAVTSTPRH